MYNEREIRVLNSFGGPDITYELTDEQYEYIIDKYVKQHVKPAVQHKDS